MPGARPHPALPDMGEACPPDQASTLLGRKGLLMKEPATRLALCAVHRALRMDVGERVTGAVHADTAVVASSNLGNVETVVEVVRTVAAEGGKAVSPMVAPNASSNVLSGTVAMWFKFGGPNLMLCSGRHSGAEAVRLGVLLLRSGRARRVVVVGAEPDDPVARRIHARGGSQVPLQAGAACVVLELGAGEPSLELLRNGDPGPAGIRIGPDGVDPLPVWGDCYGAQGILEVALAAQIIAGNGESVRVSCDGGPNGRIMLSPGGVAHG